jgi:hypothetical protein
LLWTGCARQPISSEASKPRSGQAGDEDALPFNQPKQEEGISPTSSLIPSPADVPAGTPFTVRLKSSISSASANVGDSFEAVLDEPIVVQGKQIFSAGTTVSGMVIALHRSASRRAPAYLRLKAISITWRGKNILIESSSIFAKAGMPRAQREPGGGATGQGFSSAPPATDVAKTVRFGAGRRLTFRFTATVVVPR